MQQKSFFLQSLNNSHQCLVWQITFSSWCKCIPRTVFPHLWSSLWGKRPRSQWSTFSHVSETRLKVFIGALILRGQCSAHLDRLEELPGLVPDQSHHDLLVPLVVGAVALVACGDVPRDDPARSSDANQLFKCPRRYQSLKLMGYNSFVKTSHTTSPQELLSIHETWKWRIYFSSNILSIDKVSYFLTVLIGNMIGKSGFICRLVLAHEAGIIFSW